MTEEALERKRAYAREWYWKNRDSVRADVKRRRAERKEQGICTLCGKASARKGYCLCKACALYFSNYLYERRHAAKRLCGGD